MSKKIGSALRSKIVKRARGCCEYCRSQAKFGMQSFSIEHIVPNSKGGKSDENNLALACQGCNNRKYTKIEGIDPVTGEKVALFNPRTQKWQEHFAWNGDFTFIIGITPTGRVTVEEIGLNREGLVNLRRILYEAAEHPPLVDENE